MSTFSGKIGSILATSYGDLEIRDSLQIIDAKGLKNSSETRRNLRLDVQRDLIQCNAKIVHDFGEVAQQLRKTATTISNLQRTCARLQHHVSSARVETAPINDEANNLALLKNQVQVKHQLLADLKAHFLLTEQEQASLTSSTEPVDDGFFQNLVRAKQIHKDCQILLGSENQRLGLELLDKTSKQLNDAFQKLFRWIQREFRTLDLENPQMSFSIRRALRVLAERPALFQNCLDTFAEVRDHSLSDAFHAALTGSAIEGYQKPIEFSAHEPLRYIGDMLAWVHSSAVSERESLEALFISEGDEIARGIEEGLESEPWLRPESGEIFDGRKALGQLVNRNLTGVARLLHQRVEQVIVAHSEPVLEYKIANLVLFYKEIFSKLLDSGDFIQTLDILESGALTKFRSAMSVRLAQLQKQEESVSDDLAPPEFLKEGLEELKAVLKSYETSAASSDHDGLALQLLFEEVLDPILRCCEQLSSSLGEPTRPCFMINCLLAVMQPLSDMAFTTDKVNELNDLKLQNADILVEFSYSAFLSKSGLLPLHKAVSDHMSKSSELSEILELEAFAPERLTQVRHQLDDFLPSAMMDAMENLKRLQSSAICHDIIGRAAERFCEDFERVEAAVVAGDETQRSRRGHEDDVETVFLRDVFPRTSEQIRILLS